MEMLKNSQNKINWEHLSMNPSIFIETMLKRNNKSGINLSSIPSNSNGSASGEAFLGPAVSTSIQQPVKLNNSNKIVSLIVTHNSRMQCLLKALIKKTNSNKEIHFQNCAIVRLELKKDTSFIIDLVYEGELSKNKKYLEENEKPPSKKKNYFFTNCEPEDKLKIEKQKFSKKDYSNESNKEMITICNKFLSCKKSRRDQKSVNFEPITNNADNNTYVFYIIRHGECLDNEKDPYLNENGIMQSLNAGKVLYEFLEKNKELTINYLFASDLVQTRITLLLIRYEVYSNRVKKSPGTDYRNFIGYPFDFLYMIILPCSHEIYYDGGDKCNGSRFLPTMLLSRYKNTLPAVKYNKDENKIIDRDYYIDYKNKIKLQIKNSDMKVDGNINPNYSDITTLYQNWMFYTKFYGEGKRGDSQPKRESCRNTSMIEQAIKYIKQQQAIKQQQQAIKQQQQEFKRLGIDFYI
jgi:broad specificity phosphatase PhoE